ncbi:MAG TPA: ArsA family ATPase [Candidatus Dormibacteraeota bacterium]|nr:ArsA family ATPase [Candidatus Dormibacteraeota bacterium]
MAKLDFFVGKGGVGKTTVSAAYALHHAVHNPAESTLLLSTDPAHSLSDIWQQPLGDAAERARLRRPGRLYLWQVNAEKKFRGFLNKHKEAMLSILEKGSIFSRQDIEPLLNTTLPGMAEMSALLAIDDAFRSGKYDRIVVDTAPFGHTLRLFELPQYFSRFLDFLELATDRDRVLAAHFGGNQRQPNNPILAEWRLLVEAVQKAFLTDAKLFLVTTAESFSLNEAVRCSAELRAHSPPMEINAIVLNRVVLGQNKCNTCQQKREMTRAGRRFLKKRFPSQELYIGEDSGAPIVGLMGLEHFGRHVFAGKPFRWKPLAPTSRKLRIVRTDWPVLSTPLSLVLGKGGVGKTTISAALGFHARAQEKVSVELCSVDPAPSLDDIFQANITGEAKSVLGDPKFRASELDSAGIFRDWVSTIKHSIDRAMTSTRASVHVDLSFERQLFATLLDSVPPGLDEILAVVRIFDLLSDRSKRVVIDMAPTGHALDLLRTPERILAWTRALLKTLSAHRTLDLVRDAGVTVAQLGKNIRDLLALLNNSQQTCIYTVMLAEPLPDRETERLVNELRNLKMNVGYVFVNRLLFPDDVRGCRRCGRASRWQMATLAELLRNHAERSVYLVRNFPSEIAGKRGLRSLTGELWRVA